MNVIAAITLQTLTTTIKPGEAFALSDVEAQSLIARGFATPADGKEISSATNVAQKTDNEPNQDEQHIQDIVDAIDLLNKDKDFSHNDGKPHANALSQVLDTHVSASERDEAWELYDLSTLIRTRLYAASCCCSNSTGDK